MNESEELEEGEMGQEIQANKVELNFSVSTYLNFIVYDK